jgi:hypothetical protein
MGSIGGCGLNLGTCDEGSWRWRTKPKNEGVRDLNLELAKVTVETRRLIRVEEIKFRRN